MTRCDLAVDAGLVMRTIGGEQSSRTGDLVEQGTDLERIVDIAPGRRRRGDLPGADIGAEVQLAP